MGGIDEPAPHDDDARPMTPLRALLRGAGLVLVFIALQAVVGGIVLAVAGELGDLGEFRSIGVELALALCVIQATIAAVAVWWIGRTDAWRAAGLRSTARENWLGFRALIPIGLVAILPGVLLAAQEGNVVDPSLTLERGAVLVLLAMLIGVNEELWFRGLLVAGLARSGSVLLVVFGSAVLFGLPHITDEPASWLNAAAVTLAVGIPFAAVRVRRRALGPLIAWHGIVDIWAFIHTASVTVSGTPSLAEAVGGLILPAALALGYLVWLQRGIAKGEVALTR
ncbi:MAG: family intrarane metalloprotease [Thermoleophilia bacterium]|nr:family intrarane metalloprotease [Thermoleophilia bacterium]